MEIVKISFNKEISELESHIQFNESLKQENQLSPDILTYLRSYKKKEYEYRLIIITLYGLLESHVDKLIKGFLERLELDFEYYNFIDHTIKQAHFSNSLNLATILDQKNYPKFDHLDKQEIITNLYQCSANQIPFILNKDSFLINTGNLKHKKIAQSLVNLGINLDQEIRAFPYFQSASENTFNKLDNLIVLRNEIAHGHVLNILDSSEITPMIEFLKQYFDSICEIVENHLNQLVLNYKFNFKSYSLGKVKLFRGNIIGFENKKKYQLTKINRLIIKRRDGKFLFGKILSKKLTNGKYTIKLDKNLKRGFTFYIENASA
jgi:hypothetical protein